MNPSSAQWKIRIYNIKNMKNITEFLKESLSSKDDAELKKLGFVKFIENDEVFYELKNSKETIQITQEEPGDDRWWNVRVGSKKHKGVTVPQYIETSDGEPSSYESPLEAGLECLEYMKSNNIK